MKKFIRSIELIIVVFFLIRLVGITNPPLDMSHSWRQVTGLMVARNFVETDNNILYPRVDDNNGTTGIIGMEFPAQNYLIYSSSLVLGYAHWLGRLINLIISSIGIWFFYKLIAQYFNQRLAYISTVILLSSIWFSFSRKTMPDTFCISLFLAGTWYGLKYLQNGNYFHLLLYFLLSCLGLLSKIPAGIYLAVFIIPFFSRQVSKNRKIMFLLPTAVSLLLMYWWYFIWNFHLAETYGSWYNYGSAVSKGSMEVIANIGDGLEKFYFSAFFGYLFFAGFITGVIIMILKKEKILLTVSGLVFITFFIYILKSGSSFTHHSYYIIPFVPVMALVCGYAISHIRKEWIAATLIVLGISESIINQQHDFFIKPSEKYKMTLEPIADFHSKKTDLIAMVSDDNPQQLYLAHRKGWAVDESRLSDTSFIPGIKKKGCKLIFINRHDFDKKIDYEQIYCDENYRIYCLDSSCEYYPD